MFGSSESHGNAAIENDRAKQRQGEATLSLLLLSLPLTEIAVLKAEVAPPPAPNRVNTAAQQEA